MLKKSLFFVFVFAVMSLQTAFSQGLINGTVVDVVDGRTLIVANSTGNKINVRLRYLEIPEPEQPLFDVVKNHLKDLALGKKIYVTKVQIFSNYTLGVVLINERAAKFDLSQQMIRDGAGWFDVHDASAVTDESADDYKETQILAKNEKRGVWSISGMKTPWDYREEKNASKAPIVSASVSNKPEKKADDLSLAEMVKNSSNDTNGFGRLAIYDFEYKTAKTVTEPTAGSSNSSAESGSSSDLNQIYFAQSGKGHVSTKDFVFTIPNGKTGRKMALGFGYNYDAKNSGKSLTAVGLVVGTQMNGLQFLKGKNVSLILGDGTKVNLGVPQYLTVKNVELIRFVNVPVSELLSILQSETLTIAIGKYKKKIDDSYKQTIDNFVNTLK
jgi:endonuclease YncB( thermonuclease family)